jgi:hypothetical protein
MRAVSMAGKMNIPVISTFHIQAEHLAINSGIGGRWFIPFCYRIWTKEAKETHPDLALNLTICQHIATVYLQYSYPLLSGMSA